MNADLPMAKFEALAQRLFEGSFERVLGAELTPGAVAARLLQAVEEFGDPSGSPAGQPPRGYVVSLNREDLAALLAGYPELEARLSEVLERAHREQGGSGVPTVRLQADDSLSRREIRVTPAGPDSRAGNTTAVRPAQEDMVSRLLAALDAFVIIEGQRHVPLDRPIMTIGRHIENDIVLDHASVSRYHAQIRFRHGHFVLYDAGSRGGTTVNGQPVQEWVLRPGDLIYLARHAALIYGEGLEERDRLPSLPAEGGQETAVIPAQEP